MADFVASSTTSGTLVGISAACRHVSVARLSEVAAIDTELMGRIVVAEENASAALEVMSRFALAPQWLAYLPPTMSPSETSEHEGWLERPEEAFASCCVAPPGLPAR
jgi:hypothetical protein